jgi:hypothetical protein
VQNLTQTLMWVKYNTFYVLFPVHKICLLFTELNNEDKHIFLYFSNVLYLHLFVDWRDVFMWTGNLRTLFCLTKRWKIQIIYRFTWKYIICLRCVCLKLVQNLTQTLMWVKYNTFYVLFPVHKICLLFTELNNEDKHIFRDGELRKHNTYCYIFLMFYIYICL